MFEQYVKDLILTLLNQTHRIKPNQSTQTDPEPENRAVLLCSPTVTGATLTSVAHVLEATLTSVA